MLTRSEACPQRLRYENGSVLTGPSKAWSISKTDWDRVRPVIASLYLDQELTLTSIQRIMVKDFGFRATHVCTAPGSYALT